MTAAMLAFRTLGGLFGAAGLGCAFLVTQNAHARRPDRCALWTAATFGCVVAESVVREFLVHADELPPLCRQAFGQSVGWDVLYLAAAILLSLLWVRLHPRTPLAAVFLPVALGVIVVGFLVMIAAIRLHLFA